MNSDIYIYLQIALYVIFPIVKFLLCFGKLKKSSREEEMILWINCLLCRLKYPGQDPPVPMKQSQTQHTEPQCWGIETWRTWQGGQDSSPKTPDTVRYTVSKTRGGGCGEMAQH